VQHEVAGLEMQPVEDLLGEDELPGLATLEIAVLLLDHRRTAEVRELAEQSKRIFDPQGVAREALATLEVFREAAAREALTAALVLLAEFDGRAEIRRD